MEQQEFFDQLKAFSLEFDMESVKLPHVILNKLRSVWSLSEKQI
jgi:hypothetical protein